MILLGVLASAIMGSGLVSRIEPRDQPKEQVTLPMSAVGGGVAPEQVALRPQSEFKFDNIVHQAYDYSCGSAALTTVLRYHLGYEVTEQQAMEGMLTYGESDKIVARRGFSLRSWSDPVALPLRLDAYRGRHYFRAERIDRAGALVRLDLCFG